MPTWYWKKNDLAPSLADTLLDGAGNPVDLTTAVSVTLTAKNTLDGTTKIAAAAAVIVAPPTAGNVRYDPVAADSNASGVLKAVWSVTWPAGKVETFPVRKGNDELLIVIAP